MKNDHHSLKVGDRVVRYANRSVLTGIVTELLHRPNKLGLHWVNVRWSDGQEYAFPEEQMDRCNNS